MRRRGSGGVRGDGRVLARWLAHCTSPRALARNGQRSALVLKLMTSSPRGDRGGTDDQLARGGGGPGTGTIANVAARRRVTVYRCTYRFKKGQRVLSFLEARCREAPAEGRPLQIVYGATGGVRIEEITLATGGLPRLRPVRIGTPLRPLQLDCTASLEPYTCSTSTGVPSLTTCGRAARLVDYSVENWQREDEGSWEIRNQRQHSSIRS